MRCNCRSTLAPDAITLEHRQLSILWTHFSSRLLSVQTLAVDIKRLLTKALQNPAVHPLGPMAKVPAVLRELIRNYVVTEAFRSTNSLRERQEVEIKVRRSLKNGSQ